MPAADTAYRWGEPRVPGATGRGTEPWGLGAGVPNLAVGQGLALQDQVTRPGGFAPGPATFPPGNQFEPHLTLSLPWERIWAPGPLNCFGNFPSFSVSVLIL